MSSSPPLLRSLARAPALHFALLGSLLFLLRSLQPEPPAPLVVSEERLLQKAAEWQSHRSAPPDAGQRQQLVAEAIDEELLLAVALEAGDEHRDPELRRRLISLARFVTDPGPSGATAAAKDDESDDELFAEALALDLHRKDPSARQLLLDRARYRLSGGDELPPPDDAALADFLERHRAELELPPRVSVVQLLFAAEIHADPMATASEALLDLERRGAGPEERALGAAGLPNERLPSERLPGDGGPLPARPGLLPHDALARRFSEGFADLAFSAEIGRWQGPVASPWGAHLLWVEERLPAALPRVDEMRAVLIQAWTDERRRQNLAAGLERLRRERPVQVELPPSFWGTP